MYMDPPDDPHSAHDSEYWKNKGDAFFQEGNCREAIAHYKKALGVNPEYSDAWNNLGCTYLKSGDVDSAIACSRAIKTLERKEGTQPKIASPKTHASGNFPHFFPAALVGIVIKPKNTFKNLADVKTSTAFLYYAVLCVIVVLIGMGSCYFGSFLFSNSIPAMISAYLLVILPWFWIAPQLLIIAILLVTTRIFGGKRGIHNTIKSSFFGLTPFVIVLPLVWIIFFLPSGGSNILFVMTGYIAATLWSGYLISTGLREYHKISRKNAIISVILCFLIVVMIIAGIMVAGMLMQSSPPPYQPVSITVESMEDQYLITLQGGPGLDEIDYIGINRGNNTIERIPLAIQAGAACTVPAEDLGGRVILIAKYKDGSLMVVFDKDFNLKPYESSSIGPRVNPTTLPLPSTSVPTILATTQPTPYPPSVNKTIFIEVFGTHGKYYVRNQGGPGVSVVEKISVLAGGAGYVSDRYDLGIQPGSYIEIEHPRCGNDYVLVTARFRDGSIEDIFRNYLFFECNATV
jgi:hypothetical protein